MGEKNLDQALVEKVQRGDKRAFDLLVKKYQHRIMNVLSRYLNNPDDVLDITQEAFIKAYRALPTFRGDSAFYTWLYRIAINTAKNHLVSQSRRPTQGLVDNQEAEQFDSADLLRENATPERLLQKEQVQQVISKAFEDLPDDLRTAISLRELEGMSYEEIADAMDCPIGTVRSRIFRAREAIDKKLEPLLKG